MITTYMMLWYYMMTNRVRPVTGIVTQCIHALWELAWLILQKNAIFYKYVDWINTDLQYIRGHSSQHSRLVHTHVIQFYKPQKGCLVYKFNWHLSLLSRNSCAYSNHRNKNFNCYIRHNVASKSIVMIYVEKLQWFVMSMYYVMHKQCITFICRYLKMTVISVIVLYPFCYNM